MGGLGTSPCCYASPVFWRVSELGSVGAATEDGRWWNAVVPLWAHPTDRVMARKRRRYDMRLPRGKVYLIPSHHNQWESLSLYWRRTITLVPSHWVRLDFIASNLDISGLSPISSTSLALRSSVRNCGAQCQRTATDSFSRRKFAVSDFAIE